MKIAYIENVRIPSERAHAYQIVQTCAWMARIGHAVTLVNPDRAQSSSVFAHFNLPGGLFQHVLLRSWDPLSTWKKGKRLAYFLQRWSFVRALRAWAGKNTFDVWYTRDPAMIDALRGVVTGPWFLEMHDDPAADPARWERIKSSVTGFIAISAGVRDRLVELGISAHRICMAPDGYAPEEFFSLLSKEETREALNISNEAFVVLYSGSLYPWKGLDLVVKTWDRTPDHVVLLIIGGPEQDRLRLQALVPASVQTRVKFFGQRKRKEAIAMLPAADVGLLSSSAEHRLGNTYTSPLKQFEYLAAGLPVLASDVPSSREVLTPEVARFYAPSAEGFIEGLSDAMQDPAWREAAAASAHAMITSYSWEARTREIVSWIAERLT